jgi:hypothetical protein
LGSQTATSSASGWYGFRFIRAHARQQRSRSLGPHARIFGAAKSTEFGLGMVWLQLYRGSRAAAGADPSATRRNALGGQKQRVRPRDGMPLGLFVLTPVSSGADPSASRHDFYRSQQRQVRLRDDTFEGLLQPRRLLLVRLRDDTFEGLSQPRRLLLVRLRDDMLQGRSNRYRVGRSRDSYLTGPLHTERFNRNEFQFVRLKGRSRGEVAFRRFWQSCRFWQ